MYAAFDRADRGSFSFGPRPMRPTLDERRAAADHADRALARLDVIARIMDSAVTIPGLNIRLGLDATLGLVPAIGDMLAGLVAAYIVFEARRLGAPPLLVARMVANVVFDTVVGAVPLLGDAFDVAFKANLRNVALLRRHLESRMPIIEAEVVGRA
jgi:hypothetical protein